MKLTELLSEGPMENKKVKAFLDKELGDLRKGGSNHYFAVMHILMGALTDANFHSEAKKVPAIFGSKAKYEGDPQGREDLIDMYEYEIGPKIANICKWDGKEIVNAIGFYTSMSIGRPLGQKIESLVESKGMKIFKESVYQLNEVSAKKLLQSVVNGETSRVEGIKLSKEMAQSFLDWIRLSPYGRKYGDLPFYMLFKASFNWGLNRHADKNSKEYKELALKAKEMSKKK